MNIKSDDGFTTNEIKLSSMGCGGAEHLQCVIDLGGWCVAEGVSYRLLVLKVILFGAKSHRYSAQSSPTKLVFLSPQQLLRYLLHIYNISPRSNLCKEASPYLILSRSASDEVHALKPT